MTARYALAVLVPLLVAGGAARPADAATPPPAHVAGCDGPVALGSTNQCDFPAAGTASYTVDLGADDTVRIRAAETTTFSNPTLTLKDPDGDVVCVRAGTAQNTCAGGAAGTYTLAVSVGAAVTVYTTIDSVRTPGTCAESMDLRANGPGTPIDITAPGAAYCAFLPDTVAGDVFDFGFDSNADDPLDISIYNGAGAERCHVQPLFSRQQCTLGAGTDFRIFVNWELSSPRSNILYAVRLAHPLGCSTGTPDDFGTAPSRNGTVQAFKIRCYAVQVAAGHPLAVYLTVVQLNRELLWEVRTPDGTVVCSGRNPEGTHACGAPVTGKYALFIYGTTFSSSNYRVALTSVTDSAGCSALPSTAFAEAPATGTLASAAQMDCRTFTATQGHELTVNLHADSRAATEVIVGPDGTEFCGTTGRMRCLAPASGTYHALVAGPVTPDDYRLWVTDLDDAASCPLTTPDAFGSAPSRTGALDETTVNRCWSIAAPARAHYFVKLDQTSGTTFTHVTMQRRIAGPQICDVTAAVPAGCRATGAGRYQLIVEQYLPSYSPGQTGTFALGAWRVDGTPGCTHAGLSFAAPAVSGSIATAGQTDCTQFSASAGESVFIRSYGETGPTALQTVIDDRGVRVCYVNITTSSCRLPRTATYRMMTYAAPTTTTDYGVRVSSITQHLGCPDMSQRQFGTKPMRAYSIDDAVDVGCAALVRPNPDGRIYLRFHSTSGPIPQWQLFDTNDESVCYGLFDLGTCTVQGTGPFVLVSYSAVPASGVLGAYGISTSDGCGSADLSFAVRSTPGRIADPGVIQCLRLGTPATVRQLRFAFATVPADARLVAQVVGNTGQPVCYVLSDMPASRDCRLTATQNYSVLVWADETAGTATGRYALHLWQLRNPQGCTQLGSAASGLGPFRGMLTDSTDENCYNFTAGAGRVLSFSTSNIDNPPDVPQVDVLRPDGTQLCSIVGSGPCTMPHIGNYTLLVRNPDETQPFTGRYRVAATTQ